MPDRQTTDPRSPGRCQCAKSGRWAQADQRDVSVELHFEVLRTRSRITAELTRPRDSANCDLQKLHAKRGYRGSRPTICSLRVARAEGFREFCELSAICVRSRSAVPNNYAAPSRVKISTESLVSSDFNNGRPFILGRVIPLSNCESVEGSFRRSEVMFSFPRISS